MTYFWSLKLTSDLVSIRELIQTFDLFYILFYITMLPFNKSKSFFNKLCL